MQTVFELRYQVYCLERGYLPASEYPGQAESDQFDHHSDHFCEFDDIGTVVGYARLVRADGRGMFPFEYRCDEFLDGLTLPDKEKSAEVSRLIIRGDHRRHRAPVRGDSTSCRPSYYRKSVKPNILPSLYRQMVIFSMASGIRYWYAAMERPLARSLLLMNYPFRQVTPLVDYYGPVATYMLDMHELHDRLAARNPRHLAWLTTADADAVPGTMPPQMAPPKCPNGFIPQDERYRLARSPDELSCTSIGVSLKARQFELAAVE
jgi:N-acyl amino acid synthase of PEP-CTERM/exosortase system